ncbi:MAG TPA: PIN domain-containing protein [Actinomycetota bacterium]
MTVSVFVDTNVLVYARDASEGRKQPRARAWLDHLWRTGRGRCSMQVLHEYYVTVTRKLTPGLDPDEAKDDVRDFMTWRPLALDAALQEAAWRIEQRYEISFWDALIVAAAQSMGCEQLLTEDLQHGMAFGETRVVSPFAIEPGA